MNRMIDSLGMLLLSCALLAVGNHLLNVLIPLRLNEAEVETLLIGVVMSANAVGIVLGCFYGKLLVIRVGYVRTFVLSCTLFTAIVLTYALFTNAYAWLVLRVLGGFFTATAYVVVESWLNSSSSVENRGQVLGWYLVVHYAATATGQLLSMRMARTLTSSSSLPRWRLRLPSPQWLTAPHRFRNRRKPNSSPSLNSSALRLWVWPG